jgi:hypothetical protein
MVIAIYLCVILSSVTQSAGAKLFNRHSSDAMLFNAVKALSALLLFALMAAFGFTLHLPTVLYGALYGVSLSLSMFAGYKALCLGPMALTSMLVSFSVINPIGLGNYGGKRNTENHTVKGSSFFWIMLYALLPRSQPSSTVVKPLMGI